MIAIAKKECTECGDIALSLYTGGKCEGCHSRGVRHSVLPSRPIDPDFGMVVTDRFRRLDGIMKPLAK